MRVALRSKVGDLHDPLMRETTSRPRLVVPRLEKTPGAFIRGAYDLHVRHPLTGQLHPPVRRRVPAVGFVARVRHQVFNRADDIGSGLLARAGLPIAHGERPYPRGPPRPPSVSDQSALDDAFSVAWLAVTLTCRTQGRP